MKRLILFLVACAMVALPAFADPAGADDTGGGGVIIVNSPVEPPVTPVPGFDPSGWYGQVGLAVAWLPDWSMDDVSIADERSTPCDYDRDYSGPKLSTTSTTKDEPKRKKRRCRDRGNDVTAQLLEGIDSDPGVGFGVDARVGHRYSGDSMFKGFLANEIQLQYIGDTELRVAGTDAMTLQSLYFGWNARAFPFYSSGLLPEIVEPYLLAGVGGKYVEINGNNLFGSTHDCLAFAYQAGLGLLVHSPVEKLPLYLDIGASYQGSPNNDLRRAGLDKAVVLTAGIGVRF